MSKRYNGGFPPIIYCPKERIDNKESIDDKNKPNQIYNQERFFTPNVSIRQILKEKDIKKPIIDINIDDSLEIGTI